MSAFDDELSVPMAYGEIVSHDVRHAVVNYANHTGADLLVLEDDAGGLGSLLFGEDDEWIADHASCDVLLVDVPSDLLALSEIALVTNSGPFDPFKVEIADALAADADASLVLVHQLGAEPSDERRATVETYHEELADLVSVPVTSRFTESVDAATFGPRASAADLVMIESDSTTADRFVRGDRLADVVRGPTIELRPHRDRTPGPVARLFQRLTF
jgi:hypothetical protein